MTKQYAVVKYVNPKGITQYAFNRADNLNLKEYWRINEEPKGYIYINELLCNNSDKIDAWLYNHRSFNIRKCNKNFNMLDDLTNGNFSRYMKEV